MSGDWQPASSHFGHDAELAWQAEFPVLGVPLTLRSNHPRVLELAEESFGMWRALPAELVAHERPATYDVVVHDGPGDPPCAGPLVVRQHGPLFMATRGSLSVGCYLPERRAVGFVPRALLDDPLWFRWFVMGLALHPLCQEDRVPLHAASLCLGDRAVLLLGASGAGKSTLTYACLRAGFSLLGEDTVFIARQGGLRLWAHCERLCLAGDASRWFPDLEGVQPTDLPNGKRKIALRLPEPPRMTHTGPIMIVQLERTEAGPALLPLAADEWAHRDGDPGFDLFNSARESLVEAMAGLPAFRLRSGPDPCRAAELLASAVS